MNIRVKVFTLKDKLRYKCLDDPNQIYMIPDYYNFFSGFEVPAGFNHALYIYIRAHKIRKNQKSGVRTLIVASISFRSVFMYDKDIFGYLFVLKINMKYLIWPEHYYIIDNYVSRDLIKLNLQFERLWFSKSR